MKQKTRSILYTLLLFLITPLPGQAAVINFENIPGGVGVPTEGLAIGDQYLASEGVSFRLADNSLPVIARVGAPLTAFVPNDNPFAGEGVGSFFLTDDGEVNPPPVLALRVIYDTPTSGARGVILDIDFDEAWTITAFDADLSPLTSVTLEAGDPGTGNRVATPWSVEVGTESIYFLNIHGTRGVPGGFGLAFDNFNARSSVPLPGAIWLLSAGMICLVGVARRSRRS